MEEGHQGVSRSERTDFERRRTKHNFVIDWVYGIAWRGRALLLSSERFNQHGFAGLGGLVVEA